MMSKKEEYVPKAKTVRIKALSRTAIKIRDNYYTVEAVEERELPDSDFDLKKEWSCLYDSVNCAIDDQVDILYEAFKKAH